MNPKHLFQIGRRARELNENLQAQASPRSWQVLIDDLIIRNGDQAVAQCVLLSERFGGSPDADTRLDVADVLWSCVLKFGSRGEMCAAVRVAEEIRTRLAGDRSFQVEIRVSAALSLIAEVQGREGQVAAAIETYDEALALAATFEESARRGAAVELLLGKAKLLARGARHQEAIVLIDAALSAIGDAIEGKIAPRTRQAAFAIEAKLDYLCTLERYEEARALGGQLSDALSRVLPEKLRRLDATSTVVSEAVLAEEVAAIVNGSECWEVFESTDDIPVPEAAATAMRLYGISEPWVLSGSEPASAAAALVRTVADGYALLSHEWSETERGLLPLPDRAETERDRIMRQQGVAGWAGALGHPLNLRDDRADADVRRALVEEGDESAVSARFAEDAVKGLYLYEFATILCTSSPGWEALHDTLAAVSTAYLRSILEWHRQLLGLGAPARPLGFAGVCWLTAGNLFALSHSRSSPQLGWVSIAAPLRDLLHESGGYAWLIDQNVLPPVWCD